MRRTHVCIFLFVAISFASCDIGGGGCTPPPPPPSGHITATINGKVTSFAGPISDADLSLSFIAAHEIHMKFMDGNSKYVSWTVDFVGIDVANMKFPYTVVGPNTSGIIFGANILDADPAHSPYGKLLAGIGTNTTMTVTILSIEDNWVKGTFSGTGVQGNNPATFTGGEFSAKLTRLND